MFFNRKKSTPKNSSDDIGPRAGPGPGRAGPGRAAGRAGPAKFRNRPGPAFSKYDIKVQYTVILV